MLVSAQTGVCGINRGCAEVPADWIRLRDRAKYVRFRFRIESTAFSKRDWFFVKKAEDGQITLGELGHAANLTWRMKRESLSDRSEGFSCSRSVV